MSAETARIERKMDDMADTLNRVDKTVAVLAERGTQDREAIDDLQKRVRRLEDMSRQGPRPEAPPDITQPIPRVDPPPATEEHEPVGGFAMAVREVSGLAKAHPAGFAVVWLLTLAMLVGGATVAGQVVGFVPSFMTALEQPAPAPAPPAPAARWDMAPEAE